MITINIGSVSGQGFQIGSGNQQVNNAPERWPAEQPAAGGRKARGGPVSALYAFADIVGYSRLTVRLQKMSQDDLADLLDISLAEAGIRPELVEAQDQGDARLLMFPPHTEPARVLAVMPRHLNDELLARNQDMAAHAQMRVRLSFTMGVAVPGGTGLAGAAPIAVVRLNNSDQSSAGPWPRRRRPSAGSSSTTTCTASTCGRDSARISARTIMCPCASRIPRRALTPPPG